MDASRYLREKMRGQQVYKSNWQPRDASEVTLRNNAIAQANNSTTHHGPLPQCCSDNTIRVPLPNPGNGFSTTYSSQIVSQRIAGCVQCNDPVFGKPGGVIVRECCDDVQPIEIEIQPAIYGAYITNSDFLQHSAVDPQGNTWLFITQTNTTLPIQIFNRFGTLVETIPANTTYKTGAIVFISADGISNIWANRLLYSNGVLLSRDQSAPVFDSQGNFVTQMQVVGINLAIPTYLQIFDRNSQSYFTYSAAAGDVSPETFLLKISPTGTWSGSSDSNTWVGQLISSSLGLFNTNSNFTYIVKLDTNDNIIINSIVRNTTGSTITLRSYDKSGTQFGTSIPIVSETGPLSPPGLSHSIIVKFASNGGSVGSWNAYVYNTTAELAYSIYVNNLQITSTNKIVFAFQYAGTGNEVRGSDNTIIGAALPFTTVAIPIPIYHTCIAVFGSDGTAANSFRVTIQPATGAKQVIPIAVLVDSSDSIYCVGTAQQGNNTEVIRPYDSSDVAVAGVDFTGNAGNVFFVKFTSTGVPSWISSLRGQNGPFTQFGATDNTFEQRQYINAYLDTQENLVSQIVYVSGTAAYYNTTQTLVRTLATPVSGYEACLVKISPDGLTAYSARIGQVTAGTPANTFIFRLFFDSSNNINVLGWYLDNPCGFYSSTDDTTPLVQVPIAASGTSNQFLAVYTPTLSSVQVARVVPTTVNTSAIPYTLQQMDTNYIVAGQYNGPISIFNFGNYTTTPDETRTFQGSWDVYVTNFTTSPSSFWAVTVAGAGLEYIGLVNSNLFFYQYSQYRIVNGRIIFGVGSTAMPNIYDRTNTSVTSILNNQTASPADFTYQVVIPLDGYNILPTPVSEPIQPQPPSRSCYCADPGIYRQPFPADCSIIQPSFTGALNQVGIPQDQQYGHLPKQQYPYPSG